MKRVLLTGAGGFVGARVRQQLAEKLELIPAPKGLMARGGEEEIARLVDRAHPDAILHTAAISDTGYCEAHPEESYRANVEPTLWLAKAAAAQKAKLVVFSSDQVYAGVERSGPLPEDMPLAPANVYGRHKLEAEQRGLELLPEAVFLRVTWLYDLPGYGLPVRGNLVLNLVRAALQGQPQTFSPRDFRGVTYVRQAVENLLPVLELPAGCTITAVKMTWICWRLPGGSARRWTLPPPWCPGTGHATWPWIPPKPGGAAWRSTPLRRALSVA